MNPITREWIAKAEGAWASAQREARVRKQPNRDLVCELCQQCAEKYLKARLHEAGVGFRKTHDLEELYQWQVLLTDLQYLNDFAVDYRYPGADATKNDASEAIKSCRRVRKVIRTAFGLSV